MVHYKIVSASPIKKTRIIERFLLYYKHIDLDKGVSNRAYELILKVEGSL